MSNSTSAVMQSSSTLVPLPPPHMKLYAHVLGCIFGFLTFAELHMTMLTSRSWLAVVCAMPALTDGKWAFNPSTGKLERMVVSRLARHVIDLELQVHEIRPQSLTKWIHGFPYLRILSFRAAASDRWVDTFATLRLPQSLQKVNMFFPSDSSAHEGHVPSVAAINAAIVAVSQLPNLHTLRIDITSKLRAISAISFAPLSSAHSLTDVGRHNHLSPDHVSQIRNLQMSHVKVLPCSREEFSQLLLTRGPPIPWRELINDQIWIDDTLAAILPAALPALELVRLTNNSLSRLYSFAFLPRMAALCRLIIDANNCGDRRRRRIVKMLTEMSTPLPLLEQIQLFNLPFRTEQLQQWLTLMPRLNTLELVRIHVNSLAFLSSVRKTLRCFELSQSGPFDAQTLLLQLQELPLLHVLFLHGSLSSSSTGHELTKLTLPSDLLPTLTDFHYSNITVTSSDYFEQLRAAEDSDEEND
jgi:hypothetical protein